MYNAISLIIILPCISWLFPLFFGRQLGYVFVTRMTSTLIIITTLITYYYFYQLLGNNNPINLELFNYLNIDYLDINYNFEIDALTITMLLAITTISSMVHIYSIGYMETDPHQVRFFSLLSMFTFWMIILVTGSNYFVLFVGWEFIGVTSYLLISFWVTRLQAMKSALSAVLMNRFGDAFFVLGLCVIAYVFGTLNYSTIFATAYLINTDLLVLIMLALFIAAMAKSAQFGLHNWLTLAMEGPTPVSSLLHAATLVTAGIYLLLRSANILEYTPTVLFIILWIGALTTLSAGLIAICSNDLKRIIALSTMSQLARKNLIMILRKQSICVEFIISPIINNSQVTKALYYIYKYKYNNNNNYFFNSYFALRLLKEELWKVNIISQLVGTSEAIRLLSNIYTNINKRYISIKHFIINRLLFINISILTKRIRVYTKNKKKSSYNNYKYDSILTKSSNNFLINRVGIRHNSNIIKSKDINIELKPIKKDLVEHKKFVQWLAGLIDGDGHFNKSKQGRSALLITMDIRDQGLLFEIKHKYGGHIRKIAGANAVRYDLRQDKGLINLLKDVNGLIRNPKRLLQMNILCKHYNIETKFSKPLTYYDGWLAGIIDSDGSIYFNKSSGQLFISVSQKEKHILDPLISIYGGRIDFSNSKKDSYKYIIYRKKEVLNLLDNYFKHYQLRSAKDIRIKMIPKLYELYIYRNKPEEVVKYAEWISFLDKWNKIVR
uniref:ND1-i2 protein, alternatively spliced n=2 Tax=Yarrowia lipolytica TaxID=4952 RepID=Q9B6D2_YARLI|nr:ND1-i2 protein [Yarrowia lipolytica]CAC28108.2 ND1-i2 protein, alternatively spliced [Yarrowia lipolytica]|eukprot:NP_075441.2 ND1-i2 protein (mitochondrion) [Yarrowia lipolytica]